MNQMARLVLAALCLCLAKAEAEAGSKPNIVFILMDDLGWSDVSAQGGQFETPAIDALFKDGVKLHRHYIHMMCSPSRTQFLTGRYAMYQGINKMTPWDYTEIGGIPVGQPTVAQWLQTAGYRNYGVGKWHVGYATPALTPHHKGFEKWYGFWQGAVNYATKLYDDVKYGPTPYFDFWRDGEVEWEAGEGNVNSMYQYDAHIPELLDRHVRGGEAAGEPFFMFAPLQAIHGPLRPVAEFEDACEAVLGAAESARSSRHVYCQNTLLMDHVVGRILNGLKSRGLWDNTIVVLSSDNGANLDNMGCNFPLRGTKGTLFDGNLRTLAVVGGGVVENAVLDTEHLVRTSLASNLDWTPTLLDFAGLLGEIEEEDQTWNGQSLKTVILRGDSYAQRDHLVLNVGLRDLSSGAVLFEHSREGGERKLMKYITSGDSGIDRWAWYRVNGWCNYDEEGNMVVTDEKEAEEATPKYLFDLNGDERELHNMMGEEGTAPLLEKAQALMKQYVDHPLYSEKISCLWDRREEGDPSKISDGRAVRTFLEDEQYFHLVDQCFKQEAIHGNPLSEASRQLYFEKWEAPSYLETIKNSEKKKKKKKKQGSSSGQPIVYPLIVGASLVLTVAMLTASVYFLRQKGSHDNDMPGAELAPLLKVSARTGQFYS